MEILYFTLAGIGLYVGSDWLLDRWERSRGKRFEHRDAVFFAIILTLALALFQVLQRF